ncbi:VirB4 family type IV secretion system protein [Actinocorallia longicatena]|uniref:TraG P-loop domain-containing protein n=1 Tax=Actinocorallia longicatena TaxID=111803 RepID=A0ABP6QLC4_9ACTN
MKIRVKNEHAAGRSRDRRDVAAPTALKVNTASLELPAGVCASFAVAGYPAEVGAGWLSPLTTYAGRLDVSLHVEPIPPRIAAQRLKAQRAKLEAGSRADAAAGKLADFDAETAAQDAADLAASIARGHGRLFRVGLYLTVHAGTLGELEAEIERVKTLAASMLLDAEPTTFRALQGWVATLPLASDPVRLTRAFDTTALAAAFPFTSPDLDAQLDAAPVLLGLNVYSSGVVLWDRFAQDNHNSVTLARSGAGKSYFTKLEISRLLQHGVQVAVVDPEDEYRALTAAVGGRRIPLGSPGVFFNPFDLDPDGPPDALTRRALFFQTLAATMFSEKLEPVTRSVLDRAVIATYARAGITSDPRTWTMPAPLLADLQTTLTEAEGPEAAGLVARLEPFVTGSYAGLFAGPTSSASSGHLTVFSLRDLSDEVKPVGMLLALDAIWRQVVSHERRRRLVVVDEAWTLMQHGEGARFLYRLAKSARKHWAGVAVVTQDAADLLSSDLGRAVVANSATQFLLRQAPQVIEEIAASFDLTDGERAFLLTAAQGEGLVCGAAQGGTGTTRTAFASIASSREHATATTSPAEGEAL